MKWLFKTHALLVPPLYLILTTFSSYAAEFKLQWEPVYHQRLTGYTVHYGTVHSVYDQSVDVGNQTTHTLTGLDPDVVYYFAVKAIDGAGQESDFSPEVTSGGFRFVAGMGDHPPNSGQLEVVNQDRVPEQKVPVGWAAYNEMSGEARTATGDIDGDGKDEVVIGFGPVNQSGLPGGRFQVLDDDFSHLLWGQVDWPEYNVANGETRPALGDINGDGIDEIFIGLGKDGGGLIRGYRYADGALSPLGWTDIGWPEYALLNGESWPALGDIDGDGRDDLAIGMGSGSAGNFMVKKGFDESRLTAQLDPWQDVIHGSLSWVEYALQHGETRPAVGDLNGDNKQEIVLGLGRSGGGNAEIFEFVSSALVPLATAGVNWAEYNDANGETRPAIGDIDRDGRGEIILGLGRGGGGYLELLDDARTQYAKIASLQLGLPEYLTANGSFWPAIKHERQVVPPESVPDYVLTLLKSGNGSGTVSGGGTYPAGTGVTPTASAVSGSIFTGWAPASCGSTFTLNADTTCTATFNLLPKYTLSVTKSGSGSVGSVPAGIDCGSDCIEAYVGGTAIVLTATPAIGYVFSSWSGACTGTGNCSVTMSAARSVTANFMALPKYTLTVKRSGSGTVTSTPVGISCGSDCTEAYISGTAVALNVIPASGYKFSGWSGACTGTGTCSVTMSAARSVTATFTDIPKYTLTVKRSGSGTVTSAPAGINCGSDCNESYLSGMAVALTPTPASGYVFYGWSGACTGTGPCTVTISGNKTTTATFKVN
jgi:uncharacterized repeat protein (TIGR02543 family)